MYAAPPRSESLRLLLTAVKDSPLPPQIVISVWQDKTTLHIVGCPLKRHQYAVTTNILHYLSRGGAENAKKNEKFSNKVQIILIFSASFAPLRENFLKSFSCYSVPDEFGISYRACTVVQLVDITL